MTKDELIDIIGDLKNHLPNNIAQMALKGKVERKLNNAIVNAIEKRFSSFLTVKNQWKCNPPEKYSEITRGSIDAAVYDNKVMNEPILLMEMKSHNSIDFPEFLIECPDYPMIYDILKMIENAQNNTKLYFIFFNNVVKSTTPFPKDPSKRSFFGYKHKLENASFSWLYKDKVLRVFKNWAYLLEQLGLDLNMTTAVEIDADNHMGYGVSIIALLYGPFTKKDNELSKRLVDIKLNGKTFRDPEFWEDEPFKTKLKKMDLDGIDFYYEDPGLENLGNGVNCVRIKNKINRTMVKRGLEENPLSSIGIGTIAFYKNLVFNQHKGDAEFDFKIKADSVEITITGKAVFEEDIKTKENERKVEFVCNPGSCYTILSELTISEIYWRIKNFYDEVLNSDGSKITNLPSEPSNNQMLDLVEQINTRGFLFYARMEKDKYGVRLAQYATALKKKL